MTTVKKKKKNTISGSQKNLLVHKRFLRKIKVQKRVSKNQCGFPNKPFSKQFII